MIATSFLEFLQLSAKIPFVRAWHVRIQIPTFFALVGKLLVRPLLLRLLRPGCLLTTYQTWKDIQLVSKKWSKLIKNMCMPKIKDEK